MKDFFKQTESTADSIDQLPQSKTRQGKLYVAHLNKAMIECCGIGTPPANESEKNIRNYKASVFSTTGGSYYIDGIPAILSQDDEAMLYEGELAEYY